MALPYHAFLLGVFVRLAAVDIGRAHGFIKSWTHLADRHLPFVTYVLTVHPSITPAAHLVPIMLFLSLLVAVAAIRAISTSFLFLLRIRAVYQRSTSVTALFSILWLTTAALNIFTDASIRVGPLAYAQYCLNFPLQHYAYPTISSFIFDTFVFIVISYRLAADAATEQSWRARLQSVVTGKGLFRISRALMISGQLYYLAIILYFWVTFAVSVAPRIPASSHSLLTASCMAFTNLMACKVFRGVALGMLEESSTTSGLSSTRIAAAFALAPFIADPSGRGATSKVA
ncbi:hypothetical protein FIBSPDRAFT_940636 [Athelia psychrophila]|uniref:Uncharacterized protein n=1 Tax=Athelia psychrophila TaxID=1759441 RepID=A0A167VLR4_9AGAM|nr:hypothetical protein FIBSPDRAFT_940636 [Fibularhizoctonia sp. CBS 109695]